ncbi:unnamed protein product [Amoebophrya sp. A120]|nr:unnamed protein product [Amoebophrya sp. A120]|eukprot:GSA120T00002205001.1
MFRLTNFVVFLAVLAVNTVDTFARKLTQTPQTRTYSRSWSSSSSSVSSSTSTFNYANGRSTEHKHEDKQKRTSDQVNDQPPQTTRKESEKSTDKVDGVKTKEIADYENAAGGFTLPEACAKAVDKAHEEDRADHCDATYIGDIAPDRVNCAQEDLANLPHATDKNWMATCDSEVRFQAPPPASAVSATVDVPDAPAEATAADSTPGSFVQQKSRLVDMTLEEMAETDGELEEEMIARLQNELQL